VKRYAFHNEHALHLLTRSVTVSPLSLSRSMALWWSTFSSERPLTDTMRSLMRRLFSAGPALSTSEMAIDGSPSSKWGLSLSLNEGNSIKKGRESVYVVVSGRRDPNQTTMRPSVLILRQNLSRFSLIISVPRRRQQPPTPGYLQTSYSQQLHVLRIINVMCKMLTRYALV
jgi:hypothetical protein